MDQKQLRLIRLKNDYEQMVMIKDTPIISWEATKGVEPYIEEYTLHVKLKSFTSRSVTNDNWCIVIRLPDKYPIWAPHFQMIDGLNIFHPDWWQYPSRWGSFHFSSNISLLEHIRRMLLGIVYAPGMVTYHGASNRMAAKWYEENLNSNLFPTEDVEEINELFQNIRNKN